MKSDKGLIRSQNRRGAASGKLRAPESRSGRLAEPSVCERCGAVFSQRAWRSARVARPKQALLAGASWVTCPACKQQSAEEYLGRVLVRGAAPADDAALRRRIRNVAARAEFTQPERRIVSIERSADVLEVLTTSQKLAHRIVHELKKAFGGRAVYRWIDDGSLHATWRK